MTSRRKKELDKKTGFETGFKLILKRVLKQILGQVLTLVSKLDFETGFETGRVVLVVWGVERSKRKNGSKRSQGKNEIKWT